MSHFSEVKTKLTEARLIKKALSNMGFEVVDEGNSVEVRGFFGNTQAAEFKALTRTHYDIGFAKTAEGNYELVADWELMPRVSGIEQDLFLRGLKREYAKLAITEIAQANGFDLQASENEENQSIEMVVTQW